MIYKIFRAPEWAALQAAGRSKGAPIDLADGYIHFSTATQVAETAAKHFAGAEGLQLVAVDGQGLGDALKWEVSRGGAKFPHLYRDMTMADVAWHRDMPLGADGTHILPDNLE